MCGKQANKSNGNWIKLNLFLTGLNACMLLRSGAAGEDDDHITLDTRRPFPTLVFVFLHLQFLPFYLNLMYKQQCQKLPGWSKHFFYQGQPTPFISWWEKGSDLKCTDSIKKHDAFTTADCSETILTLVQPQLYAKIYAWTTNTLRAFCWMKSWKLLVKRNGPSISREGCVTLLRASRLSSKRRADTALPASSTPPQLQNHRIIK